MRSEAEITEKRRALKKRVDDFVFPTGGTISEKNRAHSELLCSVIKDPDCDMALYTQILAIKLIRKDGSSDTKFQNEDSAQAIIASSPHTELASLEAIFKKSKNSWDVLSSIARNPKCSPKLLKEIYKRASSFEIPWCGDEVIRGVLLSPIADIALLRNILSEKRYPEEIRAIAYSHQSMPLPDDDGLKKLNTTFLSRLIKNPGCDENYLKKIIALENCDKSLCEKILAQRKIDLASLDPKLLLLIARKTNDPSIVISQIGNETTLLALASDNTFVFDIRSMRAIVKNPHYNSKITTALLLNKNANPFLSDSAFRMIVDKVEENKALTAFQIIASKKNASLTTLKKIAERSTDTEEVLIKVLNHESLQLQLVLIENEMCNEIINLVLEKHNTSAAIILSAASNRNASAETLGKTLNFAMRLTNSNEKESVFLTLAKNRNASEKTLGTIASNTNSTDVFTSLLERDDLSSAEITRIFDKNKKKLESSDDSNINMKLAFAKNKKTELYVLTETARNTKSTLVLATIAAHENTNADLLMLLYTKKGSQDKSVRLAIAQNKNAGNKLLEKVLADSKDLEIYDAVVSNPNCDANLLAKASLSNGGSFFKKINPDDQVLLNIVRNKNTNQDTLLSIAKKTKNAKILEAIIDHSNWKPEFSRTIVLPVQNCSVTLKVVEDKTTDFKMLNEIGYQALLAFKAKNLYPDTLAIIWINIVNHPNFNPGTGNQQPYSFTKLLEFIASHAEFTKEKYSSNKFNELCKAIVNHKNTPANIVLQIQKINKNTEATTAPHVHALKDLFTKDADSFEQEVLSCGNQQTFLSPRPNEHTVAIIENLKNLRGAISKARADTEMIKSLCAAYIPITPNKAIDPKYRMFLVSQLAQYSKESLSLGVDQFFQENKSLAGKKLSLMSEIANVNSTPDALKNFDTKPHR